jgi:hypothetical protein
MQMSHSRIAFALLAGLAICCSVMYVTADGADVNDEVVLAVQTGSKSGVDAAGVTESPSSVDSVDVQKAGQIYTNTPDGRMRLTDYLANVEKEIEAEEVPHVYILIPHPRSLTPCEPSLPFPMDFRVRDPCPFPGRAQA